jgi:hypothetical protein
MLRVLACCDSPLDLRRIVRLFTPNAPLPCTNTNNRQAVRVAPQAQASSTYFLSHDNESGRCAGELIARLRGGLQASYNIGRL